MPKNTNTTTTTTNTPKALSWSERVELLAKKRGITTAECEEQIKGLIESDKVDSTQAYYLLLSRSRSGSKQYFVFVMQRDEAVRTVEKDGKTFQVANAEGNINGKHVTLTFWNDATQLFNKLQTGKSFAVSGRMQKDDYQNYTIQGINSVEAIPKDVDVSAFCTPLSQLFKDKNLAGRDITVRGKIIRTVEPTQKEDGKRRNNGAIELIQSDDDLDNIVTAWFNFSAHPDANTFNIGDSVLVSGRASIDADGFREPSINARAVMPL